MSLGNKEDEQKLREVLAPVSSDAKEKPFYVLLLGSDARENDVVMAQVESNTREQAMKGNLPGAVQQGVVRALTSHQKLATLVLKSDRQAMSALTDVIYEMISKQLNIDLDEADD